MNKIRLQDLAYGGGRRGKRLLVAVIIYNQLIRAVKFRCVILPCTKLVGVRKDAGVLLMSVTGTS